MENPLSSQIGFLLRNAAKEMSRNLASQLAPLGLSSSEAAVMVLILHNRGVIQSQLCKALGVKRANMAPLVQRLTRLGWIEGFRNDGRSLQLQLTETGMQLAKQAEVLLNRREDTLVAAVPADMGAYVFPILTALFHAAPCVDREG
jgi:DNA-binding MarR family transcriptional regulator